MLWESCGRRGGGESLLRRGKIKEDQGSDV